MTHCTKKYGLSLVLAAVASLAPLASLAVTISETFDPYLGVGQYSVSNNSGKAVYAFAVGNNAAVSADGGEFQNVVSPDIWSWAIIVRADWESGISEFGLGAGNAWTVPDISTLNWDSIFGADIFQVVSYWVVEDTLAEFGIPGTSTPILPGEVKSNFTFEADVRASPFITFGLDGGVIDQGEMTVVPVPAAAWLFVSGLLGLAGTARKVRGQ